MEVKAGAKQSEAKQSKATRGDQQLGIGGIFTLEWNANRYNGVVYRMANGMAKQEKDREGCDIIGAGRGGAERNGIENCVLYAVLGRPCRSRARERFRLGRVRWRRSHVVSKPSHWGKYLGRQIGR